MSPDVAIIGAGVIGAAIADTLSRVTRLRIVVFDRAEPGCEASNAAAGVLAVASVQARRGVLFDLRRRSAALFPELVATLQEETGIDLDYRTAGLISLAFSALDADGLRQLVEHRVTQGLRCELLEPTEVRRLEPVVSPHLHTAALFPDDRSINSARLVNALVAAARRRGVQFRMHAPVRQIDSTKTGVRLVLDGEHLDAALAIVAAGAWSHEILSGCGIKIPLRPARGEMAALRPTRWGLRHTLTTGEAYVVPRDDGEVLVGSTTAFAGFDKRVTPEGLAILRERAVQMIPAVHEAAWTRTWAGLRPCSTIRRPIIAPLPGVDHVLLASGHHRNGILLAPITARMIADMVTGAAPSVPLRPFSYRRH